MPIVDGIIVGGSKDKTINYCGEVIISDDNFIIREVMNDMVADDNHEEEATTVAKQEKTGDSNEVQVSQEQEN